ncbi:DNA phosphorothioation-dependent restriction protein DptF [Phascolarctobacterium succinatutens]|uniref:DNA phosphorothioation-dependent restriction protein DptF n=1 Tax=Phascolarctobacterium succinatutens TaxID=626940 RepID=UPI0026EA5AFD|nr:DNA phosphorothioation-dependent restriction protein DptF [Phascolarctobacterium succinatutens]
MACEFIMQLSKLRKSSAESVENTNAFNHFKEYLHVERHVEIELRKLLRSVNEKQGKCLVLLCGSAGDGKSHLISYMKNSDTEGLLDGYELYNDATESSEPTLTSIDTLADKLTNFDDEHYDNADGSKMIIAINLGTLNNFIESEKGKSFIKLRKYVEENDILSSYAQETGYKDNSVFQHVSFADYQVFSLSENGIQTVFLENLLEKVFSQNEDNPFYQSYKKGETNCQLCQRCPVRHNFEFLSDPKNQQVLIHRIVQAVIIDKTIVATREVLNLLYDLIVHPDFDKQKISIGTSVVQYLNDYISWTTPMLLNEYEDISPLINAMRSHDVLRNRTAIADEEATRFHSLDNIEKVFEDTAKGTPYIALNTISNVSQLGGIKPELKKIIYRFIARLKAMEHNLNRSEKEIRFEQYLSYLYNQNSGNEKKLAALYESTKKAVLNWDGEFGGDFICIDESNEHNWILEELKLKAAINKDAPKITGEIKRFSPTISLRYKKDGQDNTKPVTIKIDFALYELISDMKAGYRPTIKDKNRHTDFVSFVQQLIELGNKEERVTIIPKDGDKKYQIVFEENDFGFEFKVVK